VSAKKKSIGPRGTKVPPTLFLTRSIVYYVWSCSETTEGYSYQLAFIHHPSFDGKLVSEGDGKERLWQKRISAITHNYYQIEKLADT